MPLPTTSLMDRPTSCQRPTARTNPGLPPPEWVPGRAWSGVRDPVWGAVVGFMVDGLRVDALRIDALRVDALRVGGLQVREVAIAAAGAGTPLAAAAPARVPPWDPASRAARA